MDISKNNLPDEQFFVVQNQLKKWLKCFGVASWKQIQKTCKNLLAVYPESYSSQYGTFPEYKLFMPLLRNGICEVAKVNSKTCYVILSEYYKSEGVFNPLLLLNNFPCLKELIKTFRTDDSFEPHFKCDLKDKYTYKPCYEKELEIGIFKPEDKIYSPSILYDGKKQKIIPNYDENPDSINIARCFVRCHEKQKLFVYHEVSKKLNVCFYSELPILITRALILFDKSQLRNNLYYYPLSKEISYHDIDDKVLNELWRIFDKDCIEVLSD